VSGLVAHWDCHAHVFGPYDRYPLAPDRSYTPPEATAQAYQVRLAQLGCAHGVLVHPSAYGTDFSLLLDTLDAHPTWRGVVVLRADTTWNLRALRDRGVRGVRFSHRSGAGANFAGSASVDDLVALAPRLADAGLHAELWTDTRVLPAVAHTLAELPVPVVIDHMGGFEATQGAADPGFGTLLRLVEGGRTWVKLCAYRNLLGVADVEVGRPFHRALLAANPDRLVWGSDWPHLRVEPQPDAHAWLQRLHAWTADPALVDRILGHNPAALYG
jgi:predicted TIM-barrel fold metal-dependent hydrolase